MEEKNGSKSEPPVFPVHSIRDLFTVAGGILNSTMTMVSSYRTVDSNLNVPVEAESSAKSDPMAPNTIKVHVAEAIGVGGEIVEQGEVEDEENGQSTDDEEVEVNESSLPPIFYIKTNTDQGQSVNQDRLFSAPDIQDRELMVLYETWFLYVHNVMVSIPAAARQRHFQRVDEWQAIPELMNQEFNSNLLNMDAARIYETLMMTTDTILPAPLEEGPQITYNVVILCPPTGGAVTGTKMFFDLACPHLKVEWAAFTNHPWKENLSIQNVMVDDSVLFMEPRKWKFILNEDLFIKTKEEVASVAWAVKSEFAQKVDLVVGDLSPAQINLAAGTTGVELINEIKNNAIPTEAAQILIAIQTLKFGGSLIMSLMNVLDLQTTFGSIGFLCGLFTTVSIIFTRPSSTWIRPAMLVCTGYKGYDAFQEVYPDLKDDYLRLVVENLETGNHVLMAMTDVTPAIREGLIAMSQAWVTQEAQRLNSLVASHNMNILSAYQMRQEKLEVADEWLEMIHRYVIHASTDWDVTIRLPQPCNPNVIQRVMTLQLTEAQMIPNTFDLIITRLKRSYMINDAFVPDRMDAAFNQVETQKDERVKKERMPASVTFSRFTSLQTIFDQMTARKVGAQFPFAGYARRIIGGEDLQTCVRHTKENLVTVLIEHGFEINIDEEHLVVACANFSTSSRLAMNEGAFHAKVIHTIHSQLCNQKTLDFNDSLFVCMLPLTTRLLLAVVCYLSKCFDKVRLIICKKEKVMGILFEKFKGQRCWDVAWTKCRLSVLARDLDNNRKVDLEFVPLEALRTCIDYQTLMDYNNAVIGRVIGSTVNVLMSALERNSEVGLVHNNDAE